MIANAPQAVIKSGFTPVKSWMVVYTRSNWEKKTSDILKAQGISSYCPLIKVRKKWADRYKTLEQPLFKSYLFVQITMAEQIKVLQISGVIGFVKHCNVPVSVSGTEIERIKSIIMANNTNLEIVNYKNFSIGEKIIVNNGPFINQEGQIKDINGSTVLMVLEQLGCALILKISQSNVTRIMQNHSILN
ncbi:UpxY family transcription antiterminator [Mucilaginibacter litoreus]|uniref:UpxY family transcription antiterminator n=1 Tax=Mucilaginibacter litoreus TaxID=1048221 RepID=A0ABW3ATW8_9SPHI